MQSACGLPCARISGGSSAGRAVLELMLVIGSIKVAEGSADQVVLRELPLLESANAHTVARSAGACVGSEERPMEDRAIALNDETVQMHLHVGERGHEFLGSLRDGSTAYRRSSAVDRERAVW